jgi:Flp pilus assembly protein TadB
MLAAEPTASFNITQLITQLVGTFATAFLGVMSAFLLERHKRRRQLKDREKEIAEAKEDRRFEALLGAQGWPSSAPVRIRN